MSVAVMMVCVSWSLAAVYAYGVVYSKANMAGLEDISKHFCLGACFVYFNQLWGMLSSALCFFFPCTVMVCLYTKIFVVAEQHVRKIGDKNNSLNDRGRGGLIKQSESKAAKTLSIVLGVFIFCWMPFFMQYIIDPLTGFYINPYVLQALYWLSYLNSACNPIIYALFYPSFKKCFHCIITLKIFSSNSTTMNLSKWHITAEFTYHAVICQRNNYNMSWRNIKAFKHQPSKIHWSLCSCCHVLHKSLKHTSSNSVLAFSRVPSLQRFAFLVLYAVFHHSSIGSLLYNFGLWVL